MITTLFERLVDFGSMMRWHESEVLEQLTPSELEYLLCKVIGEGHLKVLGNGLFELRGARHRFSARPGDRRDGSYVYNGKFVPHLDALLSAVVGDIQTCIDDIVRGVSKKGARAKPAKLAKPTWVGSRL